MVFSPGNKAHSFGHPNVEVISNRFLEKNVPPMSDAEKLLDANLRQHTMKLNQIESQLAVEQKRAKELNQVIRKDVINNLDYQQLDRVKCGLLYFKHKLES
ncbi:hypothetical protein BUALT_Bualt01G0141600 [Buddleja alternifolia]|uniref:Uncharacterized protein n=1 Tax=Buddleja alternifolia TaxID=168488 RepID=A0AAV6YDI8_9LAMI|nr:hypothetical protein BUALT_Bualt01G0141600 [Buddleja alternifolia]